jgi:hypothetical protein
MTPLLPCPFCGSPAALQHIDDPELGPLPQIQCTGAGCWATITGYVDEGRPIEHVVEAWNRRTGSSA